ncbi:serine/threonine kinase family protein, partial [Plesiocystis pacifica SIR-1]
MGPSTSEARDNSTIAGWSHPPTMDSEGGLGEESREHSENTAATALDSQPGGADPEVSGFLDTVLPDGTPPPAGRGEPDSARFGSLRPDSLDLPAAPQPGKGDKIGRYTIEQRIGEGGMGVVYLAHDPELDRRVAIKSLRSDAWSTGDSALNTKMRQRLRREAQALAQLEHPHVVAVYDTGIHDGNLFVAMAYVEGQDLRGWLKANDERPLSAILDLFADAGEGLAAAHRAELIHRDFKPDNVLIDRAGRAQVADFGLARGLSDLDLEDEEDATPMPSLVATLTRTGALMGTPPYMAPELFRGERGDAQSDQFAYCVTLFEAVYGQRPFQGRNLDA